MYDRIRIIWSSRVEPLPGTSWTIKTEDIMPDGSCLISLDLERKAEGAEVKKKSIIFNERFPLSDFEPISCLIKTYCDEDRLLFKFQYEENRVWAEVPLNDLEDFLEIKAYQPFFQFGDRGSR